MKKINIEELSKIKNISISEIEAMIDRGFISDFIIKKNGSYSFNKELLNNFDNIYKNYQTFNNYLKNPSPYSNMSIDTNLNNNNYIDLDLISGDDSIEVNWNISEDNNKVSYDKELLPEDNDLKDISNNIQTNENITENKSRERFKYDENLEDDTLEIAQQKAEKELSRKERRKKASQQTQKRRAKELQELREKYKKEEDSLYQKRVNEERKLEEQKRYETYNSEYASHTNKEQSFNNGTSYNSESIYKAPTESNYNNNYSKETVGTNEKYSTTNHKPYKEDTNNSDEYTTTNRSATATLTEDKPDTKKPESITFISTGKSITSEIGSVAKNYNFGSSKINSIDEAIYSFHKVSQNSRKSYIDKNVTENHKQKNEKESTNKSINPQEKKEQRKEPVQNTASSSPEDQTKVNSIYQKHRNGFGVANYLNEVRRIASDPAYDNDIVQGYRKLKDYTELFISIFGVRAANSNARTQLRGLRINDNAEITGLFVKLGILKKSQILSLRTKNDVENAIKMIDAYFKERGVTGSSISSYSTRELKKLKFNKKNILNDEDIKLIDLLMKLNKVSKSQKNAKKSKRKRNRSYRNLFYRMFGSSDIMQGYMVYRRAVLVVYKTVRFTVSTTKKGIVKTINYIKRVKKKRDEKLKVKINEKHKHKPLSDRRKKAIERRDVKTLRKQDRMSSERYKKKQERKQKRKDKKEKDGIITRLKARIADTKAGKVLGAVGNVVFAPLRWFNSGVNFIKSILIKIGIALCGLVFIILILNIPIDLMARMMTTITGFFAKDERPVAVRANEFLEEEFVDFYNSKRKTAEKKKPLNPNIEKYDNIIVVFMDSDGNKYDRLRNTKEIISMANIYFENAYAVDDYRYSKYEKYCKKIFKSTHNVKYEETEVTYCSGCKEKTEYCVDGNSCPNAVRTEVDIPYMSYQGEILSCPGHTKTYCPGHVNLIMNIIIHKFYDTDSIIYHDEIGKKERDAWAGWEDIMIGAVEDLIKKDWLKEYGQNIY